MRWLLVAVILAGCLSPQPEPDLLERSRLTIALHLEPGTDIDDATLRHMGQELAKLLDVPVAVQQPAHMEALGSGAVGAAIHDRYHRLPEADIVVMVLDDAAPGDEAIALVWAMHSTPVVVIWQDTVDATARAVAVFPDAPNGTEIETAALLHGIGHRLGLTPCPLMVDQAWCERHEGDSVMRWEVSNMVGRIDAARDGIRLADSFDQADRDAIALLRA